MIQNIAVNTVDLNSNIMYPIDEIERGLCWVAQNFNSARQSKSIPKILYALLERTREQIFERHDLKQGLIYKLLGDYYLLNGQVDYAKFSFEIAHELLFHYRFFDLEVKRQLEKLAG